MLRWSLWCSRLCLLPLVWAPGTAERSQAPSSPQLPSGVHRHGGAFPEPPLLQAGQSQTAVLQLNAAFTSLQCREPAALSSHWESSSPSTHSTGIDPGDVLTGEALRRSQTSDQVLALTGRTEPPELISSGYRVCIYNPKQILAF